MHDGVQPLSPATQIAPKGMRRTNGTGTCLLGFSRPDKQGCVFATRWVTGLYFPLVPLHRYYLRVEKAPKLTSTGRGTTESATYQMLGVTALKGREIAGTYFYGWLLAPVVTLIPIGAFAAVSGDSNLGFGVVMLALLVSVVLTCVFAVMLNAAKERHLRDPVP